MDIEFGYYLNVLKQRFHYALIPAILLFAVVVVVALKLPPTYLASATILIESPQIPENLVQSTVRTSANERIKVIEQRVMTRENLLRIVDKYGLFIADQGSLSSTEIITQMRDAAKIKQAFLAGRRDRRAFAFTVSFEYEYPRLASMVANEFVSIILDEDLRNRTSRAAVTRKFLSAEVRRLSSELSALETQTARFKAENKNSLPENISYRQSLLLRLQSRTAEIDQKIGEREKALRILRFRAPTESGDIANDNNVRQIEQLRLELVQKRGSFSDDHPEIKRIRRQIGELEKADQMRPPVSDTEADAGSPDVEIEPKLGSRKAFEIAEITEQIDTLKGRREKLGSHIEEVSQSIDRTGQVQLGLSALQRNYEQLKHSYREASSKTARAEIGEKLEENSQSERFAVLEHATVPTEPISPNRMAILALGFFGSIAAGFAPLVAMEILDDSVKSAHNLERKLNRRAIVSVPYIDTPTEFRKRRRKAFLIFLLIAGAVAAAVGLTHFYYRPLDILISQILNRF